MDLIQIVSVTVGFALALLAFFGFALKKLGHREPWTAAFIIWVFCIALVVFINILTGVL
jgi:hypothetical protein